MAQSPSRQIRRAAAVMMASVFVSRILGYARDAVIAYQHGATPETDAYFVAFTIPDFLNYLLAGGSLSITFIPIFARYLAEGKEEEGFRSFSTIATVMGVGMLFFIVLGEFLAGREHGMAGFAGGVLAGAFLGNFALQLYGARRGGLSFRPRLDFSDPGLKEFVRLSIPIMLGFSLVVGGGWTQGG